MNSNTQGSLEIPPIQGGIISGAVTDFEGVPLVGVRVEATGGGGLDLDQLPELTDGEGRFAVQGLADGRYDLRFSLGTVSARALAVPVGTDQLSVRLARPQGILVLLRTQVGAEPAGVCHLILERHAKEGWRREHCGRTLKSRLLLWSIRPGLYRVTAWASPYLPVCADGIQVVEGQAAPAVEIAFGALGACIEGTVQSASESPGQVLVAWRRLDAESHVPLHLTTQEAQADGNFVIRGLPQGKYRVTAVNGAGKLGHADVEVSDAAPARADVSLN